MCSATPVSFNDTLALRAYPGATKCNRMMETTGSIGEIDEENPQKLATLDRDVVSFHGKEEGKSNLLLGTLLTVGALAAIVAIGGFAHKNDWAGKITNEKWRNFFKKSDVVTKYCHDACAYTKKYSIAAKDYCVENYHKVVNYFKKK